MKYVHPWLIVFLWRQALPVTLVAMIIAVTWALFTPQRLHMVNLPVIVFIVNHAIALVIVQGRPGSGTFAYLYTRGFTRDRLWAHQLLASAAAVVTVVLPVGVVLWSGLRAAFQDRVWAHPHYPGAAMLEHGFIIAPLIAYALVLPVLHYVWIRQAQPMRAALSGLLLALAFLSVAAGNGFYLHFGHAFSSVQAVLGFGGCVAASLLLLVWGWRLHRDVEVTR